MLQKNKTEDSAEDRLRKIKSEADEYIASCMRRMAKSGQVKRVNVLMQSCEEMSSCALRAYTKSVPGGMAMKKSDKKAFEEFLLTAPTEREAKKMLKSILVDVSEYLIPDLNTVTRVRKKILNDRLGINISGSSKSNMRFDKTTSVENNLDFIRQFVNSMYAQTPRWKSNLNEFLKKSNAPKDLKGSLLGLTASAMNRSTLGPIKKGLDQIAMDFG